MVSRSQDDLLPRERRYRQREVDPYRTPFQRDRDRVLYSPAFRRLAGITQCASAAHGHIFHNRLTHTLKVAQIGSRLAMYLKKPERTDPDLIEEIGGIDIDVVETACLCHDLGHPPFGHAAEKELNDITVDHDLSGGFEGNAQSFHMVTSVIRRSHDYPGLNLTRASLNAILKYPWPHSAVPKKFGYYEETDDEECFEWVRKGSPWHKTDAKAPEADIMDWADDVAYSLHDVDDFFRAGFVPLNQLVHPSGEQKRFVEWAVEKKYAINEEWAREFLGNLEKYSPDLFRKDFRGTKSQLAGLSVLTSVLITRYLGWDPDKKKTIYLQSEPPYLVIHEALRREVEFLKSLMEFYVYDSPALVAEQFGHRKIIRDLFDRCFVVINKDEGNYRAVISPPFFDLIQEATNEELVGRLVIDFITSMTEQQALSLYGRVTGTDPGSIRDRVLH